MNTQFQIPSHYLQIETIDMHTGGEPLRVVTGGFPEIKGSNILEKRRYCKEHLDHLRKALMWEPRGHADMYGCLITAPNDKGADFGVLFFHNAGYSTMCGHATIALGRLAIELGWVTPENGKAEIKIDAPCGRLTVWNDSNNTTPEVHFHNVPSFVLGTDYQLEIPAFGTLSYDIAYGGAYYAFVDADKYGIPMEKENYLSLIKHGMAIKHHVINKGPEIVHPFEEDLGFLYGTIFYGASKREGIDSKNVCIFADGEVDRCPTGSGVSARMALHTQKGELQMGETMAIESITGSVFKGKAIERVSFGKFNAVIPEVSGTAHFTGKHTFIIDPDDPFKEGFLLR